MTEYLTVSSLSKYLKSKFDRDPYLERVYLTGEISNFRENNKYRQQYLTIKDERTSINATLPDRIFHALPFKIENGMKVLLIGRVTMNARRSDAVFEIAELVADGAGALAIKLEQLKKKLTAEGLFDSSHKKALPTFAKKIAVITAPSGAVIHDIITTVNRRFPMTEILLFPSKVSGNGSVEELVNNLQRANARDDLDLIIIGRGGGSIEDLWSFNEEALVRAIYDSRLPVISSVGHETDTTLADFVADRRAATPTAAAELATPNSKADLLNWLKQEEVQLDQSIRRLMKNKSDRVEKLSNSVIFRQPERLYDGYVRNLDDLIRQLTFSTERRLQEKQHRFEILEGRLKPDISKIYEAKKNSFEKASQNLLMLDISKIKARGFSIVRKDEKIVKSVKEVNKGDQLEIELEDGVIKANAS